VWQGGDVVPTYDFTYALEMMLGRSAGITAATVDRFGEQLVQEHEGAYVRSVKVASQLAPSRAMPSPAKRHSIPSITRLDTMFLHD
jgi:hypothetical protein